VHEPVSKRHPMIDMEEFERRLRRRSSGNQTDDPLAELARLTSGQQDSFQRVAEPQGQSSTEARQVATSSSKSRETEARRLILSDECFAGSTKLGIIQSGKPEKIRSREEFLLGSMLVFRRRDSSDPRMQHPSKLWARSLGAPFDRVI
jgi:hypothetical protein